jgi:hypothetical protein
MEIRLQHMKLGGGGEHRNFQTIANSNSGWWERGGINLVGRPGKDFLEIYSV